MRQGNALQVRRPAPVRSLRLMDYAIEAIAPCPFQAMAAAPHAGQAAADPRPLYTPDERVRRDRTAWTLVQGVLAPLQFLIFAISLVLVLRFLATGEGYGAATASVVIKTFVLYTIMITGCFWEKEVFGKWLFAPAFFWEDVFSMLVLALHTAYVFMVLAHIGTPDEQMSVALAAYAAYIVNAAQFVLKLRAARLDAAARAAVHAA
jgi:3-vinyl bacteriochlorophyllide hydratase